MSYLYTIVAKVHWSLSLLYSFLWCFSKVRFQTLYTSKLHDENGNIASTIVPYEFSAEYIINKLSAYSIRDDNQKIPIDCGKCHVKHDVKILLT